MIIPERFRRLISFFLSFTLLFQTFTPAVLAVDDTTATASASPEVAPSPTPAIEPISPTPTPTSGSNPEVSNVSVGVDYRYKDTNMVVRFTKITKPGKLTIREIKLTPEQIAATGALSDTAYDITSDMENGTFAYDLTLPLPQNEPNAKVEFAHDQDSLGQSLAIEENITRNPDTITIRSLDHFTIFLVTSGEDRAVNGGFCGDAIDCSFDADLPSLEAVDSDYLEISSFVDGNPAFWGNGDFSDDRYVQFNFSPGLDSEAPINNSQLNFVYKTNEINGSSEFGFGGKLVVSADDNFDEGTDFVTTSITPDATKPSTDQSFTINLPKEYLDADTLNNLKVRFYFFGDALGEDVSGVTTSFNRVILDVNPDSTLPVITVLGDNPVTVEINSTYTDTGSTAIDDVDGNISSQIVVNDSNVDTLQVGSYTVYFDVDNSSGNSAVQKTRTVNVIDSIANAFAIISANLAAPGSDIANNLNLVNTNNVSSFSPLYFEKSIDGTPVGKLTFTGALDLSDGATQTFLQNLGSKLDQSNGRIALDATESEMFASTGASLEMYDIMSLVTSSNLVVRDDNGTVLDPSDIISGFVYDSEANKVTFDTAHFTQFDIDITAPATPSAAPAAGDYNSDQSVILTSSDGVSGVDKIYYTTDNSTPDKTKTEYIGAIVVNKDLTIKAIAYDNAGNASDVLEAVYGIAPVISAETSSSTTATSATITWTTDDLSTSRVVYDTVSHVLGMAPNYGYANSTVEDSTKVTSHSVGLTGLTSGTTYYYRTVSHGSPESVSGEHSFTTSTFGGVGGSGVSDGRLGTPSAPVCSDTKPGSSPTLLSAFGGVNNVTLKWTEATDPLTYYLITYGTKSGAQTYGNPNIGGKGTTGYTVSGLSGGITYYFQVRAGNGCAPGDFSNEISATTRGITIVGETPAEGFAPGVKGASTDLTPTPTPSATPTSAVLGETKNNQFSWWLIFLLITTGGFGAWTFFRRR